jgi:hypothetical protein
MAAATILIQMWRRTMGGSSAEKESLDSISSIHWNISLLLLFTSALGIIYQA